jgi:hypothetical protein
MVVQVEVDFLFSLLERILNSEIEAIMRYQSLNEMYISIYFSHAFQLLISLSFFLKIPKPYLAFLYFNGLI